MFTSSLVINPLLSGFNLKTFFVHTFITRNLFRFLQVSHSNSRHVTLEKVERDTAGKFKCEVSADAPLFHTDMKTADLIVTGEFSLIYTYNSHE